MSVPLRRDGGLAVFDAEIDHKPRHLLFDTGASSLILFKPHDTRATAGSVLMPEAMGSFDSNQIHLNSLKTGTHEFRKELARVTDNPKPSQIDFDGLVSPATLGISRVSVDLDNGVLAFNR